MDKLLRMIAATVRTPGAVAGCVMSCLIVLGSWATPAAASTLGDLYAALRLENLRLAPGGTQRFPGDEIYFYHDLVNKSASTVTTPYVDFFGTSFYLAGVEQTWIERLGPDPTIPMPWAARKGNWYASGGELLAFPEETSWSPDDAVERYSSLLTTTDFAAGQYRYYIEYKQVDTDVVIDTISVVFTMGDAGVPVPGTLSLLGIGLLGVGLASLRKPQV